VAEEEFSSIAHFPFMYFYSLRDDSRTNTRIVPQEIIINEGVVFGYCVGVD
jgi:hypothetical protein